VFVPEASGQRAAPAAGSCERGSGAAQHRSHGAELVSESLAARRRDLVWAPAILTRYGSDQTVTLQGCDRAIQGPGTEPDPGEALDVLLDRIAVPGTFVETYEHEQASVGHHPNLLRQT
jgi:hypothetical protein